MATCSGCGESTATGFAFCPRCGTRQPVVCVACGGACDPQFAFCPHCGTARGPAASSGVGRRRADGASEADRRHVTVLFADLSGFTALAERLDPEDVRALQNRLFETLASVIARYDGFVEKFVGDAVLSVFGAPVAHEDDPDRACHAALEMLERCNALSAEWEPSFGQPVQLHVGIHTGPVVAGHLGGTAGAAYAVSGDTVNTTARLLAAAEPGSVLVSEATHALVRHRFAFEAAGALPLRGKSEPVVVHRLTGVQTERGSGRGLAALGLASPFVGRADELDQLLAAFDRMRRGRAQVVSVVGQAGIGKSRLIAELMARLEDGKRLADVAVRSAVCSSLGEPTYGVFGRLFREAYHIEPADSLDVARRKLLEELRRLGGREDDANAVAPVLAYVLGLEGDRAPALEPEQLRRQILFAARTLVERRLDSVPLLIIVEDSHRADNASMDLIMQVADQLTDRPLMLLLTQRPDARPPVVARAAQSVIRLAPLSGEETRTLVSALFTDTPDVLAQVQDLIVTRAGGNPLFVEEVVRNLVGRGVLVRRAGGWTCTAACEGVDVPPSLQGVLLSRVDRLPADARRVLQEAAILGTAFDAPLLHAASSAPGTVEVALDMLVEADLLQSVDRGQESYRFVHGLLREVVYQNLLVARRTEMHEGVGWDARSSVQWARVRSD